MYRLMAIRLENFRLLRQQVIIKFSPTKNHIVSVTGVNEDVPHASSNMSGKSTFANAITWALYGCDLTGKSLASNVISEGAKTCKVVLVFADEDNDQRRVRVIRERDASTTTLSIVGTGMTPPLNESGVAMQMQEYVDSVFGARDVFLAAHVFGYDETYVPFALATDKEQKQLFDLLVDASDLNGALLRAKEALQRANIELDTLKTKEAAALSAEYTLRETIRDMEQSRRSVLTATKDEYDRQKALRDGLRVRVESAKGEYDAALAKISSEVQARDAALETWGDSLTLHAAEAERLNKLLTFGTCPTCGQAVERARFEEDYRRERALEEQARAKMDSIRARFDETHDTKPASALNIKLDALRKEYAQAVAAMQAARHVLESQKVTSQSTLTAQSDRLRSVLSELKDIRDDLAATDIARTYADFWVTAFGPKGIRAMRLESAIPILNVAARKYSRALFGDGQCVTYATTSTTKAGAQREVFSVALLDSNKQPIDVRSAGQNLRRDIAVTLSLCDLADALGKRSCSLRIFDEAFRTLDQSGINAVCELLNEQRQNTALTLVIEHNEELSTRFDETITVTRNGGESTLDYRDND